MKRSGDRGLVDDDLCQAGRNLGSLDSNLTTETQRYGEQGGCWGIVGLAHGPATGLRRALRVALSVLREIFDESAYDRFLVRNHAVRSVASYREFLREREGVAARRPRCC